MCVKIILLICWIFYSIINGYKDALMYHNRNTSSNPDKKNIHWIYLTERIMILLLMYYFLIPSDTCWHINSKVFVVSLGLLFSFFHNGMYGKTRNALDENIYPKGWWSSSSDTSQANMEFGLTARIFMAITGIIGIIATLI